MQWVLLFLAATDPSLEKAITYLTVEVPAWKKNNGCFSCHNNGDAARALMAAGQTSAIGETLAWLATPEKWDAQQSDAPFRDKDLARIQFSLALAEAVETKAIPKGPAIAQAALALAKTQHADGSWPLEQDAAVGSPATYGTALATYAAWRTLRVADPTTHAAAIAKAEQWIARQKPVNTPDAAAKIFVTQDRLTIAWLLAAQTKDGGWGPYKATPAEAFDTAIATLALFEAGEKSAAQRGAQWLRQSQLKDGGWTGTTRPSGAGSYAQHISTSGWATLALLKARQ